MFKRGFTLIELILVVVIIGILIGSTGPLFRKTFSGLQLGDVSSNMAGIMKYAQERAVSERLKFRMNFNFEENKYWLSAADDPDDKKKFNRLNDRFGKEYAIPKGISFSVEGGKDKIGFFPNGEISEFSLYLTNESGTKYKLTTEGMAGYVKVFKVEKR